MLDEAELAALADDIKKHGLREPLWRLPDGTLLDGRNRLAACNLAGVEPKWRTYEGADPIALVVSLNMARRHLTSSQRAMIAVHMEPLYAAEALERKSQAGASAAPGKPAEKDVADLPHLSGPCDRCDGYGHHLDIPCGRCDGDGTMHLPAEPEPAPRAPLARDKAAKVTKSSGRAVGQAKRVLKHDAEHGTDLAKKVEAGELALDAAEKQIKRAVAQKAEQEAREVTLLTTLKTDAEGDRWRMMHGDFRDRLNELPAGSVDLIVTDPPYPADALDLWADLAEHAKRVLTDQGILVGLTGQIFLDQVMERLGRNLTYAWCYVQPLPGANSRIMGRHIHQTWKPWLAYTNGTWPSGRIDWHPDTLDPSTRAKDQYRWAQGAEPAQYLIRELCPPGGTVLDPFTGTGTYGAAALAEGCRFIGVEADEKRFGQAVERLQS